MLLDPDNYSDPSSFKPSRFLKISDSAARSIMELDPNVTDPSTVVFGFGRRACPGQWLAYDLLWISIASILASFDIMPAKDENGHPVPPQGGCIDKMTSCVLCLVS